MITSKKMIPTLFKTAPFTISLSVFLTLNVYAKTTSLTPEKKSVKLSEQLKDGISDEKWISLSGQKDKIDVVKGDTLFGISKRLFGDPNYWPKIWEINNENVKNPHFIYPKNILYFSPGSESALPFVEVATDSSNEKPLENTGGKVILSDSSKALTQTVNTSYASHTDRPGPVWDERTPHPPNEWKNLPRQNWESINTVKAATIDKDGFDSRNRQIIKRATGLEQEYLLACEPINPLGQITGGRSPSQYFNLNDEVGIDSNQPLENGQTYSVIGNPIQIESDGKKILSYVISGAVKILGVNDGVHLGEIKSLKNMMERGNILVPRIPRSQTSQPVAGPSALQAKLYLDARSSPSITGQHKWIYIDKGEKDGVSAGMIFRFFQYRDPNNGRDITRSNMLVQGDVVVHQTCGGFSVGQVVWSKGAVNNETPAYLLTDIQDYFTRLYLNGNITKLQYDQLNKSDWLDGLNDGKNLSTEEDNELKQLEKAEENTTPTPVESASPEIDTTTPMEEPTKEPELPMLEGEEQLTPKAPEDAPLELPDAPIEGGGMEEPSTLIPTAPPANAEPGDIAL